MNLSPFMKNRIEEVRSRHFLNDRQALPGAKIHICNVEPITQTGPQCGLVALQMAGRMIGLVSKEPSYVFGLAKQLKFTKQGEMFSATQICQFILSGSALLVPYDCDRNFEPTLRNGHSAHWAIIVGFFYIDNDCVDVNVTTSKIDIDDVDNFYVFAYQGKSKHMGLWSYRNLQKSNSQLHEIGPIHNGEEFIHPSSGMEELRLKTVLLEKL
uniref:Actin maturation protease n=1 Tax=Heterorhabditis bacteriophora TaxID=37862 RepID=A0A1I7XJ90_HETBA